VGQIVREGEAKAQMKMKVRVDGKRASAPGVRKAAQGRKEERGRKANAQA
jgi:hypothetical protein